jgi:hypothetical protein
VTVGKSLVIDSPLPIDRLSVADGNLADAVAINPQEVLINGKAPGETTLAVWQRGGSRVVYDLTVREAVPQQLVDKARKSLKMTRDYVTKQYELGAITQVDLQDAHKRILAEEQRLAAYEAGGIVQFNPSTPLNGAPDAARSRYRAVLLERIGLARTAFELAKKRYDLGEIDLWTLVEAESGLTDVQLELAAFDAASKRKP